MQREEGVLTLSSVHENLVNEPEPNKKFGGLGKLGSFPPNRMPQEGAHSYTLFTLYSFPSKENSSLVRIIWVMKNEVSDSDELWEYLCLSVARP